MHRYTGIAFPARRSLDETIIGGEKHVHSGGFNSGHMERIVGAVSCKSELAGSLRILRINLHIGGGEGDQGLPFEAALAGRVAAYFIL